MSINITNTLEEIEIFLFQISWGVWKDGRIHEIGSIRKYLPEDNKGTGNDKEQRKKKGEGI